MKLTEITNITEAAPKEVTSITMDMPLFIRALEFAREDAKTDLDLHDFAERCEDLMAKKNQLRMSDYASLVQDMKKNHPSK